MNHSLLDRSPPAEMLTDDSLEQHRTHVTVPHSLRIDDDNGPSRAHAEAWRFAALDPCRAEEEALTLE
jgi:hypothetical protein